MKKYFLLLFFLIFTMNLGAKTQIWYLNSRGDNYYPKQNVMEAALVNILGQQQANNFLAGNPISLTSAQRSALTLPSHVTTITNYNPKTSTGAATSQTGATSATDTTSTKTKDYTTQKTTTSTAPKTTTQTYTAPKATTQTYTAPTTYTAPKAPTPTYTTPTTATTQSDGKIAELEKKITELTKLVQQLQQRIGG
ncbi:MAG: hypothetical protein ABIA74_05590 [bacterium]